MNDPSQADPGRVSDVVKVKRIVERHFKVWDFEYDAAHMTFQCDIPDGDMGQEFDRLRIELKPQGLFPAIGKERNGAVITVMKNPKRRLWSTRSNVIMFIFTLLTTVWAGGILWASRSQDIGWSGTFTVLWDINAMLMGALTFALPLLLILGTHEFGHYFTAKLHHVNASLPFFIPVPPFLGPLGTFGALISIREPLPNKRALVEIGAAGPIAGFVVAVPVMVLGLFLTRTFPAFVTESSGLVQYFNSPLLLEGLSRLFPMADDAMMHPTAFAGWVGLLVTAFNLLPAGQLDGGHIARALLGKNARYLSMGTVLLLLVLGFYTHFYTWTLFAILIFFMGITHPPPLDDITPLTARQMTVGAASLVIFILCFHPMPIMVKNVSPVHHDIELSGGPYASSVGIGGSTTVWFELIDQGDTDETVNISLDVFLIEQGTAAVNGTMDTANTPDPQHIAVLDAWELFRNGSMEIDNGNWTLSPRFWDAGPGGHDNTTDELVLGSGASVRWNISVSYNGSEIPEHGLLIRAGARSSSGISRSVDVSVSVERLGISARETSGTLSYGQRMVFDITISDLEGSNASFNLSVELINTTGYSRGWGFGVEPAGLTMEGKSSVSVEVWVDAPLTVVTGDSATLRLSVYDSSGNIAGTMTLEVHTADDEMHKY